MGGHLARVDWGQTGAAVVVGAITGGAGAFIGGAVEGGTTLVKWWAESERPYTSASLVPARR
jgi:hypothetical protein